MRLTERKIRLLKYFLSRRDYLTWEQATGLDQRTVRACYMSKWIDCDNTGFYITVTGREVWNQIHGQPAYRKHPGSATAVRSARRNWK